MSMYLLLGAALLVPVTSASWMDPAIAASETFSLDGSDWSVTGEGRAFSAKCTGGASSGSDTGCCDYVRTLPAPPRPRAPPLP